MSKIVPGDIIEINSKLISHSSKIKVNGGNIITENGRITHFKDRSPRKLKTKNNVCN